MTRDTALFERGAAFNNGWSAPRIRRFVNFRDSPLIARDDSRRPFFDVAGTAEESSPRQRERDRAGRSRERPLSHAIAVAPSAVTALVGTRPERGPQLLVDGRLDRSADV